MGFGAHWSYQILGIKDGLRAQASPNYTRYRMCCSPIRTARCPNTARLWSILYPNVMLEWYPHCLVISNADSASPDHTTNIVEYYTGRNQGLRTADRRRAPGGLRRVSRRRRAGVRAIASRPARRCGLPAKMTPARFTRRTKTA